MGSGAEKTSMQHNFVSAAHTHRNTHTRTHKSTRAHTRTLKHAHTHTHMHTHTHTHSKRERERMREENTTPTRVHPLPALVTTHKLARMHSLLYTHSCSCTPCRAPCLPFSPTTHRLPRTLSLSFFLPLILTDCPLQPNNSDSSVRACCHPSRPPHPTPTTNRSP